MYPHQKRKIALVIVNSFASFKNKKLHKYFKQISYCIAAAPGLALSWQSVSFVYLLATFVPISI